MSLADFDDRELDQLADYAAGVLEPEFAAQVHRRVATDPRWAAALVELTDGDSAVRAQLRAYGHGEPERVPADVAARLDAALAAERASQRRPTDVAPVVRLDAARHARHARRSRLPRLAAAAAAVLVVGVGIPVGLKVLGSTTTGSTSANSAVAGQAQPQSGVAAPTLPGVSITASGRDYTPSTLANAAATIPVPAPAAAPSTPAGAGAAGQNEDKSAKPPDALSSTNDTFGVLREPARLSACLAAITAVHPGQAVSVDYAAFDSQPAVIVVIVQPTGKLVVAAGLGCGANGSDELATARG
jgi:hypothetical protein